MRVGFSTRDQDNTDTTVHFRQMLVCLESEDVEDVCRVYAIRMLDSQAAYGHVANLPNYLSQLLSRLLALLPPIKVSLALYSMIRTACLSCCRCISRCISKGEGLMKDLLTLCSPLRTATLSDRCTFRQASLLPLAITSQSKSSSHLILWCIHRLAQAATFAHR